MTHQTKRAQINAMWCMLATSSPAGAIFSMSVWKELEYNVRTHIAITTQNLTGDCWIHSPRLVNGTTNTESPSQ